MCRHQVNCDDAEMEQSNNSTQGEIAFKADDFPEWDEVLSDEDSHDSNIMLEWAFN